MINATFVDYQPDIYYWGPFLHGTINSYLDADFDTFAEGGPIVMNSVYKYLNASSIIKKTQSDWSLYLNASDFFGSGLMNFKFTEFEGGYTLTRVYRDASAFDEYYRLMLRYENLDDMVALNT